ncbi:hypothetical protein N8T08_003697 [Aspergillus melleus]|uniref:Uncharacterized protein n=1 Tax=Aspergillus melleus TaxID=138277 RepID=A0ACC3B6X5_9EURO|nr:hypothetical protein N8T08_003697 [Aspergillus melleus]
MTGELNVQDLLQRMNTPLDPQATWQSNEYVFNTLMDNVPQILAGGAELCNSNQMGEQKSRILDQHHFNGGRWGVVLPYRIVPDWGVLWYRAIPKWDSVDWVHVLSPEQQRPIE